MSGGALIAVVLVLVALLAAAMQARIGTLEDEVHELRQFRDQYMELLERHSKPTLGGRS